MPSIPNADQEPNDRFGYSCYAVVVPAPDDLRARCDEIERAAGQTRAKIPAHITVKGTFCRIESLDAARDTIRSIARSTPRFWISFSGAESFWRETGGGLDIPVTPEMQGLHDGLVTAIEPVSTSAYRDDPYRAHLTYVQGVTPDGLRRAQELVEKLHMGEGFTVSAVDLMGRAGQAHGGRWELIERFPLGGA
ncbi:MAG: 2'-5' RNA ligase family protein [Chloroflexota bacterium]